LAAAETVEHEIEAHAAVRLPGIAAGRIEAASRHAGEALKRAEYLGASRLLGIARRAAAHRRGSESRRGARFLRLLRLALEDFEAAQTP